MKMSPLFAREDLLRIWALSWTMEQPKGAPQVNGVTVIKRYDSSAATAVTALSLVRVSYSTPTFRVLASIRSKRPVGRFALKSSTPA
jgi:hypothetical protein